MRKDVGTIDSQGPHEGQPQPGPWCSWTESPGFLLLLSCSVTDAPDSSEGHDQARTGLDPQGGWQGW